MIKAIETHYNGYRFRSRLEARWAVFFDTLGISYEYEPEGFDLGDGLYYLPDFWLPVQKYWIEVKGSQPTSTEARKCKKLANQSKYFVFMLFDCWPRTGREVRNSCLYFSPDGKDWDGCQEWGICPKCNDIHIGHFGNHAITYSNFDPPNDCDYNGTDFNTHPKLQSAYHAARSARFEHGETPKANQ